MRILLLSALTTALLLAVSCGDTKKKTDDSQTQVQKPPEKPVRSPEQLQVDVLALAPQGDTLRTDLAAQKTKADQAREAYKAATDNTAKSNQLFEAILVDDYAREKLEKFEKDHADLAADLKKQEKGADTSKIKAALEKMASDIEVLREERDNIAAVRKEVAAAAENDLDAILGTVASLGAITKAKAELGQAKTAEAQAKAAVEAKEKEREDLKKAKAEIEQAADEKGLREAAQKAKLNEDDINVALVSNKTPESQVKSVKSLALAVKAEIDNGIKKGLDKIAEDPETKKAIAARQALQLAEAELAQKIDVTKIGDLNKAYKELMEFDPTGWWWNEDNKTAFGALAKAFAGFFKPGPQREQFENAINKFMSLAPQTTGDILTPGKPDLVKAAGVALQAAAKKMAAGLKPLDKKRANARKAFNEVESKLTAYQDAENKAIEKNQELKKQIDEAIGAGPYDEPKVLAIITKLADILDKAGAQNSKTTIEQGLGTSDKSQKAVLIALANEKAKSLDGELGLAEEELAVAQGAIKTAEEKLAEAQAGAEADVEKMQAAYAQAAMLQFEGSVRKLVALLEEANLVSKIEDLRAVSKSFRRTATEAHKLRGELRADVEPLKALIAALGAVKEKLAKVEGTDAQKTLVKNAISRTVRGIRELLRKDEQEKEAFTNIKEMATKIKSVQ